MIEPIVFSATKAIIDEKVPMIINRIHRIWMRLKLFLKGRQ